MKTFTKALLGTVAAGAVAVGSAGPAQAQRYDYRYGRGYERGYGDPREAEQQCVTAATIQAGRYGYGNARVTDIRNVERSRDGFVVKGRIVVNSRNWRGGGWNNGYRGWNDRYRGYDEGRFTCRVAFGRVVDLDFGGIRGL